jgi:hypothetical protein
MSEPQWMAYVGAVTGVIGAVTGIGGAWMGWIAYRRSDQIKALDLRLELRKAINEIEQAIGEVNELLPTARRSRERISAARGSSGAMEVWQEQYQKDQAAVRELTGRAPKADTLDDLKPEELEAQLADVHKFQIELSAIMNRYKASIAEDDQHRAEIRQAMLNRPPPTVTR